MPMKLKNGDVEQVASAQAQAHLDMVARGLMQFDDAVGTLADSDAMFGVAKLIALRLELRTIDIVRAAEEQSDDPISVICRAAGMNINAYSAILRMRRRRRGSGVTPAEALANYQRLPREMAEQLLRARGPDRASDSDD